MITAPSIKIPKSRAPKLMRFAQTPKIYIIINANRSASGMVEATIKPPLRFPRKITKIKITIKAPIPRFSATVEVVLFISLLLSRNGFMLMPSGSDF